MENETVKDIPRAALRFTVPVCKFGDNGENARTAPVTITARSGEPIEHWYWGNIIHDLAGMKVEKPSLPLDYCHDDNQILGYVNKFDTSTGDLVVSGAVIPYAEKDRASEVIYKQKEGVPYEASINFGGDGIRVQEVMRGEVAEVNGRQFEGPGIIVRQWPLRGVAICPYGADSNTCAEFKESESPTVKITHFSRKETEMPKTNTAEANNSTAVDADKNKAKETPAAGAVELANKPAEGVTPPVDASKPGDKAGHTAFITAFGDAGARWFLEGKSFETAATEFIAGLKTKHTEDVTALKAAHQTEVDGLTTKVTDLTARLEGLKLGNEPVEFQAAKGTSSKAEDNKTADTNKFSGKLPGNLAMVAAATKMPGQRD
jgi:hypothetical protein